MAKAKEEKRIGSVSGLGRAAAYFLAGALFAGGEVLPAAYPLGVSLTAAAADMTSGAAAVLGIIVGSLRVPHGIVIASVTSALCLVRLIAGRIAPPPENREARPTRDGAAARARRFLLEAAECSFAESVFVKMAISSLASLIIGAVICAENSYSVPFVAGCVVSSLVSPALTYLYGRAFSRGRDLPGEAGRIALAASAVLSLSGLFSHFDLAVPAAFALSVLMTRERGVFIGVIYGVVCGAVLTPELAPLYAIAAIVSAPFWKISQAAAVTAAAAAGVSWGIYVSGLSVMSTVTPELIVAAAILAPLCSLGLIGRLSPVSAVSGAEAEEAVSLAMRESETSRRMKSLSESFSDISGVLYRMADRLTAPDTDALCELCDRSFENYCAKCGMRSACFDKEAKETAGVQAKMTLELKKDGRVSAAVVPPQMARRCFNMGGIIDSMNAGYRKLVSEAKLYDRTSVVAADYEIMSDVLRESSEYDAADFECDRELTSRLRAKLRGMDFSAERTAVFGGRIKTVLARGVSVGATTAGADEIRRGFSAACGIELSSPEFEIDGSSVNMKLRALPKLSVRCGRASVAMSELKRGEVLKDSDAATRIFATGEDARGIGKTSSESCGDVIDAFLTDDGRFFMLISDGMGTGKEASLTSGVCAVFLEKMLKAGASMDTSLKMLNSMMRSREVECSATVDLMELDLMNGGTRFVKSGAAPSFVLRGGRLFRLQSKTVPIGIVRALDAEMIKFETEPGDAVVMLSDGVVHSFEDCPWLYDMLCDEREWVPDPEKMARKIVRRAVENGAADDVTAGVVTVE
ncbi:MAG: SpoIIE family protein phosphatase [Clostridia bacterium]|nr:SpoIIE family protein phosphatase [Clostridia bacterium]